MNNINIDAKTLEMCLKTVSNVGSNTYQNICTGASTTVAWGSGDWMGAIGMYVMFFGLALICLGFGFMMIKVTRD